jgi:hypothetical protein
MDAPSLFDTVEGGGLAPQLLERSSAGSTLDELIVSVWEGLRAHVTVACPLCGEEMKPEYGVHARAAGGRCSGCASTVR